MGKNGQHDEKVAHFKGNQFLLFSLWKFLIINIFGTFFDLFRCLSAQQMVFGGIKDLSHLTEQLPERRKNLIENVSVEKLIPLCRGRFTDTILYKGPWKKRGFVSDSSSRTPAKESHKETSAAWAVHCLSSPFFMCIQNPFSLPWISIFLCEGLEYLIGI